jgi:hypothetical protein
MQRPAEELGVRERDDSFCCQVGFGLGVGLAEGTIVTPNGTGCASVSSCIRRPSLLIGDKRELARSPAIAPLRMCWTDVWLDAMNDRKMFRVQ